MNNLFVIFLFSLFTVYSNELFSQNIETSENNNITDKNLTGDLLTTSEEKSFTDFAEPVPSLEEQGFVKVLSEGKVKYFKKVDEVVIEYKPEQN